ncbi:MAG: ATP phosphoribosyltransferase [Caulobacter sp.]|nr:ATP phosphoribosyltransferase [Caulobacter sp.]
MSEPVILAIPSKGRLKEQVEAWLADAGLRLESDGGERGYRARIVGLDGLEVRLISAGEIARALSGGEVHLGVTGEDLLREQGEDMDARVLLLRALGFGRADLVVAAPQGWLDVETMADLEEVAHQHLARTGRRLRVATKYIAQTRDFFARHGVGDYRIVESAGATEGAPAAGAAEIVVDITTTGATLAANHLRTLSDGVILRSQAQLAAALTADWGAGRLAVARRLLSMIEARARARRTLTLVWPPEQDVAARQATAGFADQGGQARTSGLLISRGELAACAAALEAAGVGPVTASAPEYVFSPDCPPWDDLAARVTVL